MRLPRLLHIVAGVMLAMQTSLVCADVVVYLRPDGNDRASGLSDPEAVASLQVAIRRILAADAQHGESLRISVGSGTYAGQAAGITNPPDRPITISARDGDKPIFDGAGKIRTWLVLKSSTGKPSRLTIEGLEIANYVTAVSLNGERSSLNGWNGHNAILNNTFRNIGQIAIPSGPPSQAAIRLVNSRNNTISSNSFIGIRNISGCTALHAIYLAHYSSNNVIEKNTFENGCGATVKVRDSSNANTIRQNRFIAQDDTLFLDSYCNQDIRDDCTKETAECPSWDNKIIDNVAERLGSRSRKTPITASGPKIATGCAMPHGNRNRFTSKGNRF